MNQILIVWLINALALLARPYVVPSVQVDGVVRTEAVVVLPWINHLVRSDLALAAMLVEEVDEALSVSAPCDPGDAVFFHDLTLHASHPNVSGQDRYAWIVTYRNAAEEDLTYDWSVAAAVVRGERKVATGKA